MTESAKADSFIRRAKAVLLNVLLILIRNIVADRAELAAENLALRQRLAILELRSKRPRLRKRDRIFRAQLSRF